MQIWLLNAFENNVSTMIGFFHLKTHELNYLPASKLIRSVIKLQPGGMLKWLLTLTLELNWATMTMAASCARGKVWPSSWSIGCLRRYVCHKCMEFSLYTSKMVNFVYIQNLVGKREDEIIDSQRKLLNWFRQLIATCLTQTIAESVLYHLMSLEP